jgi:hypothetical protein
MDCHRYVIRLDLGARALMALIDFSPLEQTKVMQLASFAEPAGQRSSASRTFA